MASGVARFGARDEPSRAIVFREAASWINIIVWPPSPEAAGSQTPNAKATAAAASKAFPPFDSTSTPASVAL
jgi:hypothetical protein